jgi:hypothetical protein
VSNVLTFTDEFAPVWTDPDTGVRKPMTSTAWIAAGFEVRKLPGHTDLYAVDLASRVKPLEPPRAPGGGHDPSTGPS